MGSIISGLIGSSQSLPTVDIQALLNTINANKQYQQGIINQLPANVQQLINQYQQAGTNNAATLQNGIGGANNALLSRTASLYGPDSPAAQAQKAANTQSIYSTVPGTQNAVRNAMAATGGLSRGNAGVQLAQPYLQAAQQAGQANANVNAQQTAAGQNAMSQALAKVQSMDGAMFQQLYGMSQQQAQQILTTGNQALSTQLADLINSSNNATNQTLGAEGIAVNNGYQNAVTRNNQQNQIYSGLANTALQGAGLENSSGGMASSMPSWLSSLIGNDSGGVAGAMGAPGGMDSAGSTLLPASLSLLGGF